MSRKRKSRTQARRERAKSSPKALIQRGKSASERGDLNAAIDAWEEALRKAATPTLTTALAEIYFRRGVTSVPPGLNDLQRAVELAPSDSRLQYHLGRTHHWRGDLDEAVAIYRALVEKDPPYRRAAFPLAQILTVQGHDAATDPVWSQLSPNEQDRLICVKALSDGRPVVALRHAPRNGSADALWAGLAGVALDETDSRDLQSALDDPYLPSTGQIVAHYYLGVAAGRQGRWQEAITHWKTARGAGLDTPWLRQNLAGAYRLQVQELLASAGDDLSEEKRWTEAYRLAELGLKLAPEDADLIAITQQAHLQLGYMAALSGQWATALSHWQTVNQGDKTERAMVINMALANEKLENYDRAADLWRQALRRRPRKADAPDALSDEQVAHMWQHVAENYRKAGDYEEATKVYRNAIKWDPDNVDLRLSLVEALMADGRVWAASNMVNEVLAAHPNHVEALAWQAQIYEEDHYGYAARRAWERVLDVDPQHAQARQHLAFLYEEQGDYHLSWDMFGEAIAAYQKGLEYMPDSARLYASIGLCYVLQEDWEAARQQFERAFSAEPNTMSARYTAIRGWLEVGQWDEAWAVLQQAETLTPPPSTSFYVDLAEFCQELERPEWAKRLLRHAEERNPHDPRLLFEMAMALTHEGPDTQAIGYLRRALDLDPDLAEAHLWLGNLYFASLGQTRLAKRHWQQAESIAQRNGDQVMLYEIRLVKEYFLGGAGFPPSLIPGAPFDYPVAGFFDDDDYD
jgi:tetratricopeptide (TPR) repeat protein